jgi:hypothetical protein
MMKERENLKMRQYKNGKVRSYAGCRHFDEKKFHTKITLLKNNKTMLKNECCYKYEDQS